MISPIGGNWVGGPTANRDGFRADIIAWNPGTWLVNGIDAAIFWREALPQARIGLRLMPDDAIQLEWTVDEWRTKWQPVFPLLRQYNIHVITGNEPPGHDVEQLRKIVRFEVQVAEILEGEGLFGMFGRFPVGHPSDKPAVLALLDPLIRAITARDGNSLMLNEYWLVTQPLLEQPWHVGRFQNILDMFGDVDIDIGEISANTPTNPGSTEQDSWSGWRKASEHKRGRVDPLWFADSLISLWENIYRPARVVKSINPFLLGGADDQRGQDLLAKEDEWRIFAGAMAGYRDAPVIVEPPDDDEDDTQPVDVTPIPIEEEPPMETPVTPPSKVPKALKGQRELVAILTTIIIVLFAIAGDAPDTAEIGELAANVVLPVLLLGGTLWNTLRAISSRVQNGTLEPSKLLDVAQLPEFWTSLIAAVIGSAHIFLDGRELMSAADQTMLANILLGLAGVLTRSWSDRPSGEQAAVITLGATELRVGSALDKAA